MKPTTAAQLVIGGLVFIGVEVVATHLHHPAATSEPAARPPLAHHHSRRLPHPRVTPPPAPSPQSTSPWRTAITTCTATGVTGTITNTGTTVNTYIIVVSDDSGSFELGTGTTEVVNLRPGGTTTWTSPVTFSNQPTGPVSCAILDVMANY